MKTRILKLYERALRDMRNMMFVCTGQPVSVHAFYHGELPFESVLSDVMKTAWRKVLYRPRTSGILPQVAERSVLALTRRGITRDRIRFHDGSFHVELEHIQCEIHRYGYRNNCIVRCVGDQFATTFAFVRVGPEELADLMLDFDADVPEMTRRTRVFFEEFEEMEREEKKKEMIRKIVLATRIGKTA